MALIAAICWAIWGSMAGSGAREQAARHVATSSKVVGRLLWGSLTGSLGSRQDRLPHCLNTSGISSHLTTSLRYTENFHVAVGQPVLPAASHQVVTDT